MDYTPPGDPDPDCLTGKGDITEVTAEVCRTNPFNNYYDELDGTEATCLFPFTLNGETHDTCVMVTLMVTLKVTLNGSWMGTFLILKILTQKK